VIYRKTCKCTPIANGYHSELLLFNNIMIGLGLGLGTSHREGCVRVTSSVRAISLISI
jgi:hypothetical protein